MTALDDRIPEPERLTDSPFRCGRGRVSLKGRAPWPPADRARHHPAPARRSENHRLQGDAQDVVTGVEMFRRSSTRVRPATTWAACSAASTRRDRARSCCSPAASPDTKFEGEVYSQEGGGRRHTPFSPLPAAFYLPPPDVTAQSLLPRASRWWICRRQTSRCTSSSSPPWPWKQMRFPSAKAAAPSRRRGHKIIEYERPDQGPEEAGEEEATRPRHSASSDECKSRTTDHQAARPAAWRSRSSARYVATHRTENKVAVSLGNWQLALC